MHNYYVAVICHIYDNCVANVRSPCRGGLRGESPDSPSPYVLRFWLCTLLYTSYKKEVPHQVGISTMLAARVSHKLISTALEN